MMSFIDQLIGEIPLHDRHAIGLLPQVGRIGLHRIGVDGWMVGIRLNVDLRHYRKAGATGGFMTLERLELIVPGQFGEYTGFIDGWEEYRNEGYISYFKPVESKLLPHSDEYISFALLDARNEKDPYFYFGWGLRSDMMPPYGYRRRATVAYMGVNYPVQDGLAPEWTHVPGQTQLLDMLQPSILSGFWRLKMNVTGFTVDPDVAQETHLTLRVFEGWRRYYRGVIDLVLPGDRAVGKFGVDWHSINWGNVLDPGDIVMRSGVAKGRRFRVIGASFSGDDPPPGYPPNMWIVLTHPQDPVPSAVGVTAGDSFQLCGPFDYQLFKLVDYHNVYIPSTYPELKLELDFTPLL